MLLCEYSADVCKDYKKNQEVVNLQFYQVYLRFTFCHLNTYLEYPHKTFELDMMH